MRYTLFLLAALASAQTKVDWISQIKNKPFLDAREYNWSQAPGGSLVIGSNTVTLHPCPDGVSGTHTAANHLPHRLYITGGTGTAEDVAITGGAGSGTTCTVTFVAIHTHAGAFTVGSVDSGIQEAIYVAGSAGAVAMPPGGYALYGTTYIPDGYNTALRGAGMEATILRTHFTDADVIVADYFTGGSGGNADIGDFAIIDNTSTPHTAGAMLRVRYRTDGLVSNVRVSDAFDGYWMERNARTQWQNINGTAQRFGLYVTCNGVAYPDCQNEGTVQFGNLIAGSATTQNVRIEAPTTGLQIIGMFIQGGSIGTCTNIVIAAHGTDPLNEIQIQDNVIDSCGLGIGIIGNSASYVTNHGVIQNNAFSSFTNNISCQNYCSNWAITGNWMIVTGGGSDRPIVLGPNVKDISIIGNPRIDSDGDFGILIQGSGNSGITISSNVFGVASQPTTCIGWSGAGISVTGNNFVAKSGGGTSCTNLTGGAVTNLVWSGNSGSVAFPFAYAPACSSALVGVTFPINDSTTNVWGGAISGSGANVVLGACNGSNWTVMAK